jgi:hypothetical protein
MAFVIVVAHIKIITSRAIKTTSVVDPEPGSGAFLTPKSGIRNLGWVKKIKIRIRDEHPVFYFRELRNNFLG